MVDCPCAMGASSALRNTTRWRKILVIHMDASFNPPTNNRGQTILRNKPGTYHRVYVAIPNNNTAHQRTRTVRPLGDN